MSQSSADPFFERLRPLREIAFTVLEAGDAMRNGRDAPEAESIAMDELEAEHRYTGDWNAHPAQHTHLLGNLMAYAAEDNIRAVLLLCDRDPVPVLAHPVVGRAGLNACARARWLLDPAIDLPARIGRVLAFQIANNKHRLELPASVEERRNIDRSQKALRDAQRSLGIPRTSVPSYTAAIEALFVHSTGKDARFGTTIARWWGGVAHSELYAIRGFMDTEGALPTSVGTLSVPVRISSDDVERVVAICLLGYIEVLRVQCALFGWRSDTLATAIDAATVVMSGLFERLTNEAA